MNYLVLIGQDAVLPLLFGRGMTAPGVVRELMHPGSPDRVRAWAAALPAWLEVRAPTRLHAQLPLGPGEREAISLALEARADAVLIDERKGALVAAALGLSVAGTLAVLELANEKRLLRLAHAIDDLRRTTFRASDRLYEDALRRAAERRTAEIAKDDDGTPHPD